MYAVRMVTKNGTFDFGYEPTKEAAVARATRMGAVPGVRESHGVLVYRVEQFDAATGKHAAVWEG